MFKPSVAPLVLAVSCLNATTAKHQLGFKIIPDLTANAENDEWAHVYPPVTTPNVKCCGGKWTFRVPLLFQAFKKKKLSTLKIKWHRL